MKRLTLKQKILACYGHVNYRSIAKLCNTSISYVNNVLSESGLEKQIKNQTHETNIQTHTI